MKPFSPVSATTGAEGKIISVPAVVKEIYTNRIYYRLTEGNMEDHERSQLGHKRHAVVGKVGR